MPYGQGKLAEAESKNLKLLNVIAGAYGTRKLSVATLQTIKFRAVYVSEDTTFDSISDDRDGDIDTYFLGATYTAKAGDILVPDNMIDGNVFTSIDLASGSVVLIL